MNSNKFKLEYSNICGLSSNLQSVFSHLEIFRPNILALSETQVFNEADKNRFECPGYNFISSFFPHRGIGIYLRSDLSFTRHTNYESSSSSSFSYIWISFKIRNIMYFFCFLYRSCDLSHSLTAQSFEQLSNSIDDIYLQSPGAEIIVAGDFNVHNSNWLPFSHSTDLSGLYVELFSVSNSLSQLISEPTFIPRRVDHRPSLLDLFLVSDPGKYNVNCNAPLGNSDHVLISTTFSDSCSNVGVSSFDKLVWYYNRARWDDMNLYFSNFNWSLCLLDDVNLSANIITKIILSAMHRFIPNSIKKCRSHCNSWFTSASRDAIRSKNIAFKNFRRNSSQSNKTAFKAARNHCNSVISNDKYLFNQKIRSQILSSTKGSRDFWSLIGSINKNFKPSSIPSLIDLNGRSIVDSVEKANLLGNKFAANSRVDDRNFNPSIYPPPNSVMNKIYFRQRVVHKVLLNLNIHKAAGPDGIAPIVLKNCAASLSFPLKQLFYRSYSKGICPSSWRFANITPVPKKGSPSDPSNYRPIAITSILCKVMEKIVNRKLMSFLESS